MPDSPTQHRILRTAGLLLLAATLLVGMAPQDGWAAETETPIEPQQKKGRALVGAGLAIQGVGVGLSIAIFMSHAISDSNPYFINWIYDGASVAAAPLSITGFRLALSDGSRRGDLHATSIGLFENAAYAGLLAGFSGIRWAVADAIATAVQAELCAVDPDAPACWEGFPPGLILAPAMFIQLGVSVGLLIPGIVTAAESKTASSEATTSASHGPTAPVVVPIPLRGGGGAALSFQF